METGGVVASCADNIAAIMNCGEAVIGPFCLFGACDCIVAFGDGIVALDDRRLRGGLCAFECDLG